MPKKSGARPSPASAEPDTASEEDASRHVMVAFPVPESLHTAIKVRAAQERTTVRGMVLRALKLLGFDVPESELGDRRIGRSGRPPRER